MAEDTTINGLSTALAATAAADDLLPIWDASAGAMKKHAAAYLARSDGASGHKLITGSGRELTVTATGTAIIANSGTFTPDLRFGGVATGITYASRGGYYTTLGKWCFFQGWIALSSKGSATGVAIIAQLPLTAANNADMYPPVLIQWINMATTYVVVQGAQILNAAHFDINGLTAAGATVGALTDAAFANNTMLRFSGVYITA